MPPAAPHRFRRLALAALFWFGVGLLFSIRSLLWSLLDEERMHWAPAAATWTLHWLLWGTFVPLIAALGRRFPPLPPRAGTLAVQLLLAPLVAAAHFVAAYLVQGAIGGEFPLFGPNFANLFHFELLTYFLILGYLTAIAHVRRSREEEVRSAQLAEQLAQAELAALRMQLHPHFLFNSLHSAAELVHENPAAAERSILGLADLLRRALRAGEKAEVPLAEELEFVDGYLALESVRLEGKLAIDYRVPEELLDVPVPSLLLQPLVENAIRHGVARRAAGGAIELTAEARDDGRLVLTVENDAPVPDQRGARPGTGIGLANVRARLAQRFGAAAALEAGRVAPERFRARIEFPATIRPVRRAIATELTPAPDEESEETPVLTLTSGERS